MLAKGISEVGDVRFEFTFWGGEIIGAAGLLLGSAGGDEKLKVLVSGFGKRWKVSLGVWSGSARRQG